MSITFSFQNESDRRVAEYLQSIAPRVVAEVHQELKAWIYQGANISASKYFTTGSTPVRHGVRNPGDVLISRTGTLQRAILAAADSAIDPASPDAGTTVISATMSPDTPYARIQEYGGNAGRGHKSYIPPRPYLQPAFNDASGELMSALQSAVERALAAK